MNKPNMIIIMDGYGISKEREGNAVILITHDLGVVANMADKVAVMYAGKIVEMASCDELFAHPLHPYTRQLLAAKPKLNQSRDKKLVTIEGMPPSLINPPAGCPFAERCKEKTAQCTQAMPPEITLEGNHKVSCFQHQDADISQEVRV